MRRYLRHWERFARRDPYFAVLTDERFRAAALNNQSLDEFFASGTAYVEFLLEVIRERLDPELRIRSALDFGCGVGRLTAPLARVCESVVAVDAALQMLARAEANCRKLGLENVRFSADVPAETFDLVNAYIVFQHIPPREGERIYRLLLDGVRPGGVAALHFLYARSAPKWRRILGRARALIPGVHPLANLVQRRALSEPHMQMNAYQLDGVFSAMQSRGFGRMFTCFTDHGGDRGVLIVAQRTEMRVP